MLLSPEMGSLVTKMTQSMGFWANLGKNPYFEPLLWLNHPFLGLATFRKVDSWMKMSNFSFVKFSQKLGGQDLRNSVGPLREPTLLNKVLCINEKYIPTLFLIQIGHQGNAVQMSRFQGNDIPNLVSSETCSLCKDMKYTKYVGQSDSPFFPTIFIRAKMSQPF